MNEEEGKLLWDQFELSDESVKEFCNRIGMKSRASHSGFWKLLVARTRGNEKAF